ncbi:MAG: hypothetical protein U5P41_04420 [Gammaproteobacteria bacterium]|nr:hypothetical protein [Gammaproteobacteria bacterium]
MARDSLFARWSHYQLSRLELVFAVIVILVLISVFLNYMIVMLARAERSMVDNSITQMNSALRMQAMQVYVDDAFTGIAAMRHANPVRLLEQQPEWDVSDQLKSAQLATMARARSEAALPNYAGEMDGDAAAELDAGSWYFDTDSRALVYIVRNAELFRSELPGAGATALSPGTGI